jgi:penicillin-binding protein 1C
MTLSSIRRKLFKVSKVCTVCLFLAFISFLLYDHLNPVDLSTLKQTSRVVKADDGSWLYAQINAEHKWRFPVDVTMLDPGYLDMLLAFEDRNFYAHPGLDFLAMGRALSQLIIHRKIVSGGSTITMQLARLLDPKPRTIRAKLTEILRAFQLEWHYSKEEILSAYLTLTPYGSNVEGVVGASMRYFGKLPRSLSAGESALLVSLPQSPERNRPDRHLENAINARNKVLKIAWDKELINQFEYQQAIEQTPPTKLKKYPRHAPHLAQKILSNPKIPQKEIATTLNRLLQKQLEVWARGKAETLAKDTTIALLMIRNRDASVQAYLGSHDMFSQNVSGYVDMIQAVRSPGSTMKPFIYAFGFDDHFIHPNTLILDQETRFGDYMPHNFSNTYTGEVTVAYALQHSLNIPAVKILQKVGTEAFVNKISAYTGKLRVPKKRATLPVALGGVGISMWQLSQLYVALANSGRADPIHYLKIPESTTAPQKLCDKKSAKMTTAILREVPAPEGFVDTHHQIAYKTGTSYGYRDAWAIAYSKEYTVAVWVGKPNNATQSRLTGRSTAAPLAFEAFALLQTLIPQNNWQWSPRYLGNEVPLGLTYFDKESHNHARQQLAMVYPLDNARFRNAGCGNTLVEIKVEHGLKPYYWYIDGNPKEISQTSTTIPFDYGAHTITIIDTKGATITRNIWVDKPEC